MALAYLKVVWVVAGRYFNAAGAEIHVYVIVGNNGDFSAYQRQNECFAYKVSVARIIWINCNRTVTQHCFRSGCRYLDKFIFTVLYGIANVPEKALVLGVFNLRVGKGGHAFGAPVYNAVSAINETFIVKVDKNLFDSL